MSTTNISDELGSIVLSWHGDMTGSRPDDESRGASFPGERSRLKRFHSVEQTQAERGYFRLLNRLKDGGVNIAGREERVAAIAAVLAHVDRHVTKPLGISLAEETAERRFERLLETSFEENRDRVVRQFIRMMALIDRTTSVPDLSKTIFFWNDETKQRLASTFYKQLR